MRTPYKIIFLLALVLALYLPSLKSGYFIIDDNLLVDFISRTAQDLRNILQYRPGLYYRPVVCLSYLFDALLWEMKPSFMHFVNILIHAFNAILVFAIARRLLSTRSNSRLDLPFFAAVLFAIHPLATESVNWISGRGDPLAALFSLSAFYLFVIAFQKRTPWIFWPSAILALLGSLTKEVGFAMFPAFILALLLIRQKESHPSRSMVTTKKRVFDCMPFLTGGFCYLYLRTNAFTSIDRGVNKVTQGVNAAGSLWLKIETMISAFGFYLKKLMLPFPLDFTIETVNPWYFWPGLVALSVIPIILLLRRSLNSTLLLFIVMPIFPALLVAILNFSQLPPIAERYLYVSTAFYSLGLFSLFAKLPSSSKIATVLCIFMVLTYLPITIHRNLLWTDQLKFLEASNVKSLRYPNLWHAYCVVLADRGYYAKARSEFRKLLSVHPEDQPAFINLALMELYVGDPVAAHGVLAPFFTGQIEPEKETLRVMVKVDEARIKVLKNLDNIRDAHAELLETHLKLFEMTNQPKHLLSAAQSAMQMDNYQLSASLIARIRQMENVPEDIQNGALAISRELSPSDI